MSFGFDLTDSFGGFSVATPPDGCTQCGLCLSSCPTYSVSQDAEQSPMGRIRIMRLLANDDAEALTNDQVGKLTACLGCYTCESVCPSRVDFGGMLDGAIATIREQRPTPAVIRAMLWLARRAAVLGIVVRGIYVAQQLGLRAVVRELGVLRLAGLQRADRLLGRVRYPRKLANRVRREEKDRRVALFTGCFSSVMERDVQQATIAVLNAFGLEVMQPREQGCCGALHRHNGDLETAEKLAQNNVRVFSKDAVGAIVTTSSGCGASLKRYAHWLDGDGLPAPVMDVSHYLAELMQRQQPAFKPLPLKVVVHIPCTLRQHEGQQEALVDLLRRIPELGVMPLSGEPRCCGAGGSQMLGEPSMADALRNQLLAEIKHSGADVIVSANLGCAMHLRAGLAQDGIDLPLRHPVQLVAQALIA